VLLTAQHLTPAVANAACATDAQFAGYSAHLPTFQSIVEAEDGKKPFINLQSAAHSLVKNNEQIWLGATQTNSGTTSADKWYVCGEPDAIASILLAL
jgi:hypothetical protein